MSAANPSFLRPAPAMSQSFSVFELQAPITRTVLRSTARSLKTELPSIISNTVLVTRTVDYRTCSCTLQKTLNTSYCTGLTATFGACELVMMMPMMMFDQAFRTDQLSGFKISIFIFWRVALGYCYCLGFCIYLQLFASASSSSQSVGRRGTKTPICQCNTPPLHHPKGICLAQFRRHPGHFLPSRNRSP